LSNQQVRKTGKEKGISSVPSPYEDYFAGASGLDVPSICAEPETKTFAAAIAAVLKIAQ
jgi:hypothetical protein